MTSALKGNLTLDPTLPAWTSALVIYEALPPDAQARFLLGPIDTFDAVMRTAVASGVPRPRHASGRRLTWRGPGYRAAHGPRASEGSFPPAAIEHPTVDVWVCLTHAESPQQVLRGFPSQEHDCDACGATGRVCVRMTPEQAARCKVSMGKFSSAAT